MKKPEFEISNLAKNCNEALILAILNKHDMHGYEIALEIEERSKGEFKFNFGTLYPILHKLEKEKLIKGYWQNKSVGRKRKYYSITKHGRKYFEEQVNMWNRFVSIFSNITGDR